MPFADDLLEQAYDLAHKETTDPKQASLRRAVSTAYYALFHLLVDEAVSKWAVERQRSILARTFEHSKMKGICDEVLKSSRAVAVSHLSCTRLRTISFSYNSIGTRRTTTIQNS